ncbi:TPA: CcdB family protein [Enterobacter hormaechei]|nr:CcdB family protein [Enterobacter hormaechei]
MKHVLVAPAVEVAGKPCVVMMHMMAGISLKELGERVADLTNSSASMRDALDFLISGY